MIHLTSTDYLLWLLPQLCVSTVLCQIMRQRLVRDFPYFTAYGMLQLVRFAALFTVGVHHRVAYFYTYWSFEIIDVFLSIAVIRDIYRRIFRNYSALQTFGSAVFHWAAAILVLIGAGAAAAANGREFDRIIAGVLVFQQTGTIVRGGLLLLLLVICLFFRLYWNHHQLGIVIGFSLYVVVDFVAIAMRRHTGWASAHAVSLIQSLAYNCCAFVWVWTFIRKRSEATEPFPFSAAELDGWNETLGKLVR